MSMAARMRRSLDDQQCIAQHKQARMGRVYAAPTCAMNCHKTQTACRQCAVAQRSQDQLSLGGPVGRSEAAGLPILVDCTAQHNRDAVVTVAACAACRWGADQGRNRDALAAAIAICRCVERLAAARRRQGLQGSTQHVTPSLCVAQGSCDSPVMCSRCHQTTTASQHAGSTRLELANSHGGDRGQHDVAASGQGARGLPIQQPPVCQVGGHQGRGAGGVHANAGACTM